MSTELSGKKVLITRAQPMADLFAKQIEGCGGKPIVAPLLQISYSLKETHKKCLEKIHTYEWLFFTSANGVKFFFTALAKNGIDFNVIKRLKIAVVGSKTNKTLKEFGYSADFIPSVFNAETMAPEFLEKYKPEGRILLIRGKLSRTILNEVFSEQNIPFDCLEVYTTEINHSVKEHLQISLIKENPDYITFTSPSAVDAFIELAPHNEMKENNRIVCIGTTTEEQAISHGFKNVLTAKKFTIEGMLDIIMEHKPQ